MPMIELDMSANALAELKRRARVHNVTLEEYVRAMVRVAARHVAPEAIERALVPTRTIS